MSFLLDEVYTNSRKQSLIKNKLKKKNLILMNYFNAKYFSRILNPISRNTKKNL